MCRSAIPHHDDDGGGGGGNGCAGGSLYDYGDIITERESSVPTRREGERTRARERERGRGREERSKQGWMLARARERLMYV